MFACSAGSTHGTQSVTAWPASATYAARSSAFTDVPVFHGSAAVVTIVTWKSRPRPSKARSARRFSSWIRTCASSSRAASATDSADAGRSRASAAPRSTRARTVVAGGLNCRPACFSRPEVSGDSGGGEVAPPLGGRPTDRASQAAASSRSAAARSSSRGRGAILVPPS